MPLDLGVKYVGLFDVSLFLLDLTLAILAALSHQPSIFFFLPLFPKDAVVSNIWAMYLKLILVDLARVLSFGFLLVKSGSKGSRLLMGATRVVSQGIQIILVAVTCWQAVNYHLAKAKVGWAIGLNVFLVLFDLYYSIVIFSWYRRTPQEEIEIELKRLG